MLTGELHATASITNQYGESRNANVYPGMCSYPLPPLVMPWNSQWVPITPVI